MRSNSDRTQPPERRTSPSATSPLSLALVLGLLGLLMIPTAIAFGGTGHALAAPRASPGALAAPASSAVTPAANSSTFNPNCYPIDQYTCVAIANVGEPDIVPLPGSHTSIVLPNATTNLPLVIKSKIWLNYSSAPHNGSKSPITLNVTCTLWNGDSYYSQYDDSIWHSNSASSYWSGPNATDTSNTTYPHWYNVEIYAKSSTGVANFFPGETCTWWVEITYNLTYVFSHVEGPRLVYTYAGAWPYSPNPGAVQYAGGSATFEDVNLTVTPRSPNWNDTVNFTLNTTQADVLTNATIGAAYVDLWEYGTNGSLLQTGTVSFAINASNNGFGAVSANASIPVRYAQISGASILYSLTIYDVAGDQIVTPVSNYTVGGNGSDVSGVFTDDYEVTTSPSSILTTAGGAAQLQPGQPVLVNLTSRNQGTAINFADIEMTVSYPQLNERSFAILPLHRLSSIRFNGMIPGLPLGASVNFYVYTWDFNQRLEISPALAYSTPTFNEYVPILPQNLTFFYVYVYDNGSGQWVSGASVQIIGAHGYFNSLSNTTSGLAYPNETKSQYVPLLLPVNSTYRIVLTDPRFVPADGKAPPSINVSVTALHSMTSKSTLVQTSDYLVVQEGNAILFYLNSTPPVLTSSPAASTGAPSQQVPVAGIIGLIGSLAAAIPIALWWMSIRARRKEEEKRVTL